MAKKNVYSRIFSQFSVIRAYYEDLKESFIHARNLILQIG